MRDETRTWRKPRQRMNIVAVRERIQRARERMEIGATKMLVPPESHGRLDVLDVCCQALETALLVHAFDQESSQDIVADAFCLLQAERDCRRRGE